MDVLVHALKGLMAADRKFGAAASRIVQSPADPQIDLARETVEMVEAKQAFSANVKVIRFADDMWRALMDIQAR